MIFKNWKKAKVQVAKGGKDLQELHLMSGNGNFGWVGCISPTLFDDGKPVRYEVSVAAKNSFCLEKAFFWWPV